jgi:hypothetical protein
MVKSTHVNHRLKNGTRQYRQAAHRPATSHTERVSDPPSPKVTRACPMNQLDQHIGRALVLREVPIGSWRFTESRFRPRFC